MLAENIQELKIMARGGHGNNYFETYIVLNLYPPLVPDLQNAWIYPLGCICPRQESPVRLEVPLCASKKWCLFGQYAVSTIAKRNAASEVYVVGRFMSPAKYTSLPIL